MRKNWIAALMLMCALSVVSPAFADHDNDHGNGHGNGHGNKHDNDDDRWEHRGDYDYRVYQGDQRPPGWSHGKKTGWKNCGMPPGQAKKYGCQTYVYQGTPYYYYHDDGDRIVVRRPTIHIQGSVDIH